VVELEALAEAALACGAPGVVVARREGGETFVGVAGAKDVESGTRLDRTTQFFVGSVGKTFLAALVLALVQDQKLDLDEPAATHLGDVGPIDEAVRIRDLLRHTSGLPDFYGEPKFFEALVRDPQRRWTPDDLLELVLGAADPPRAGWSYSNTNYLLLWLVIERVGGSPPPTQLRERIAKPLSLHDTHLGGGVSDTLARGYMPPDNPFLPAEHGLVDATELGSAIAYPAPLISTPADVARFLQALLDGTLLRPDLRRELLAGVPADWDESEAYGLGIARISSFYGTSASHCGHAWGHLGLALGHTTIALSREDGTRQVVLAANIGLVADEAWHPLADAAWAAFCGE
jgi:D-alanyl-D-alanine carboxypeptidase